MFKISNEVMLCGATVSASGISELLYSWLFSEPWMLIGWGSLIFGSIIMALGLFWHKEEDDERPLGVTILASIYAIIGLLFLFAGGWLFTPFFIATLLCAILSWGLFSGKSFAWIGTILISGFGIVASTVMSVLGFSFPIIESDLFLPSFLGAIYLMWYFNRPHVSRFFNESPIGLISKLQGKTRILQASAVLLTLLALLSYLYFYPGTLAIISYTENLNGGSSTTLGKIFYMRKGDLLNYRFNAEGTRIRFWIQTNNETTTVIASKTGTEGSGSATAPWTGSNLACISNTEPHSADVHIELEKTLFSYQRTTLQWLLLDIYVTVTVSTSAITHAKKQHLPTNPNPQQT